MRVRISNLAWDDATEFYGVVKAAGVSYLELAPTKIWPKLEEATEKSCAEFLQSPALQGLTPVAFQALLFGCPHLQLFQEPEECLRRLELVMQVARRLGVAILVFGSPKNRLVAPEVSKNVLGILERVGTLAQRYGTLFCLEPNPPRYGGNWALGLADTVAVLRELNHPAVRLHADTGSMLANGEAPAELEDVFDCMVSCHISVPGLLPPAYATQTERDLLQDVIPLLRKAPHLDSVGLEMARVESVAALEENVRFFTSLVL